MNSKLGQRIPALAGLGNGKGGGRGGGGGVVSAGGPVGFFPGIFPGVFTPTFVAAFPPCPAGYIEAPTLWGERTCIPVGITSPAVYIV